MTNPVSELSVVNIIVESEFGGVVHEAIAVNDNNVMYVNEGEVYLLEVTPTVIPNVLAQNGPHIILGKSNDDNRIIPELVEKMRNISMYDFFLYMYNRDENPAGYDLGLTIITEIEGVSGCVR
ncbi:hypothetical protein [Aneurinibacillus aneurinilyticus]|uniref:hypothetical protein n=1 Tax=Aneurinibacillus aneurinilyticus TaxID=1391 RepID=UPI0023EF7527|nr:hypothetical protein [Aneurinibacillus aneurinilyticus]